MPSGPIFQANKQDVMGFLWGWSRLKKKITEYISRLIPKERRKVLLRIPVYGSPVHLFKETIQVEGEKDLFPILWELIEDEDDDDNVS